MYITKVMYRAAPKPSKAPKKVLPPKVIETTEQLIEHLETGNSKEPIILAHVNLPTIDEAGAGASVTREQSA
jgi:hypothetical protein